MLISQSCAEMARVAVPKGMIGFTTMESVPWISLLSSAFSGFTFPSPPPTTVVPEYVFRVKEDNDNWGSPEYIRSQLISNSSLDHNTIQVERLSFDLDITAEEDKDKVTGMAVMAGGTIMNSLEWTEEQKKVCMTDDKLRKVLRGIIEDVDKISFVAWVVTVQKLGKLV